MRRSALVLVLLLAMLPAHAGEFWSALWRNADQRGEALLQQGDAGHAASVYADPARKAYAKLSAGDYQGAAKDLAGIQGSDAAYNRGNALAHSGDLQGALDAYDAALKSDPNDLDAKHNRELVENILKQQQSQQQKGGGKASADDKHDGQQDKGQDASAQDRNSSGHNTQGKNGEQQQDGQQQDAGQGKGDENSAKSAPQANKNSEASTQNGTGTQSRDEQAGSGKPQTGPQDGQDEQARQAAAKDEAEQARRDAQASLAQAGLDKNSQTGNERYASPALSDQNKPTNSAKTENQLAQEQWLRSIPDDPGGLLRRKFMIEHMIRLQKAQQ